MPLKLDEIVVVEPVRLGRCPSGSIDAVVEHPPGRRDHGRRAEAELGALAQPRLAIVEDRFGGGKGAAARLGDKRRAHPAGPRPAGVDGQHRLDEILVEGRAAQQAAAAAPRSAPPRRRNRRRARRSPAPGPIRPKPSARPGAGFPRARVIGKPLRMRRRAFAGRAAAPRSRRCRPPMRSACAQRAGLALPAPGLEVHPAVARDRQAEIDRPARRELPLPHKK